jgi:exodeoxyribonuclease V alpha subunit
MPKARAPDRSSAAVGPDKEAVAGLVERVTYHNPDNGFCVLRVRIRGRRALDTIVGHAATIAAGEFVHASGEWVNDREHGLQFKADFLRTAAPTTREGIEKYLASGMIKGIGSVYARRLVEAFGERVFEVIDNEPDRLREVDGIGPVRARRVVASWAEQKVVREIMIFLHSHGVGTTRAVRIFKTYGADAIRVISENPYRLARDIRGIGFLSADAIAFKLGIEKTALIRARAGIGYALTEATGEGHCGLPLDVLVSTAEKLLDIPQPRIAEALALELAAGDVIEDTVDGRRCVFLAALHQAEQAIAAALRAIATGRTPWPGIDAGKALPWVESKTGLTLAPSQKDALRLALTSKAIVITGGPGVGKTTLLNALLLILRAKGTRLALCAPTGRAAKRLSETTGLEAKTIHRLLEVDPLRGAFRRGERHPLECDLLVVDETSMVDVPLMASLLRAVPLRAAAVLVGDVDQLPSVGPGQVLADVIASGAIPVVRLTEVFRQAAESRIVTNAHRINQGLMPELPSEGEASDFYFVKAETPDDGVARVLAVVKERIPRRFGLDMVRDIQVLCPMNRGGLGAHALNVELQKALNPAREPRVERFGWTYCVGDKVMQTENDYDKEVYNGDLGVVSRIDTEESEMAVDFDGRAVIYDFSELDELTLAYAVTIHKSQGSEYPAVVIPLTTQHYPMLERHLVYTGVTRGKTLVVLVGQPKALAIAVKGAQTRRRWSRLREWLAAEGRPSDAGRGLDARRLVQ